MNVHQVEVKFLSRGEVNHRFPLGLQVRSKDVNQLSEVVWIKAGRTVEMSVVLMGIHWIKPVPKMTMGLATGPATRSPNMACPATGTATGLALVVGIRDLHSNPLATE